MNIQFKILGFRFVFIFVIAFVLTFYFPFYKLPNIGQVVSPLFESINQFWTSVIMVDDHADLKVISDSTGLYLHLLTLFIFSLIGTLVWSLIKKNKQSIKLKQWLRVGVAYYLALVLLKYGFDKIFKHQFYLPEPNTLFTPLGQLSPDILFWSSMGSSYTYSVFSGLIEVIPAILLLFRKTRLFGAILAMFVFINVMMLNFGFDISVKVFSIFLFSLTLIIIAPNLKNMYAFFVGKPTQQNVDYLKFKSNQNVLKYALLKSIMIGVLLFESLGGYFRTSNFNDDVFPRPYLHGAYTNIDVNNSIKRIFFHRKQYFITQSNFDKFTSYKLQFSADLSRLVLTNDFDINFILDYKLNHIGHLSIKGVLENDTINLVAIKENLDELPLLKKN